MELKWSFLLQVYDVMILYAIKLNAHDRKYTIRSHSKCIYASQCTTFRLHLFNELKTTRDHETKNQKELIEIAKA